MIELCLTNLGKYNEGELIYSRLVLPATTEEIQAAYDEIGVAENTMYEEAFISDYETDINGLSISEYASLDDLNELAEELENFDEYELDAFGAMLDYGYATDEALKKVQDGDYMYYSGCYLKCTQTRQDFCTEFQMIFAATSILKHTAEIWRSTESSLRLIQAT